MATTYVELKVSAKIASETEIADTYTPPNGSTVTLIDYKAQPESSINSSVSLVFPWATPTPDTDEAIIWSGPNSIGFNKMDEVVEDSEGGGPDGTKKVALVAANDTTGELIITGKVRLRVDT